MNNEVVNPMPKRSNKIVIALLIILVLALSGYIVYDKLTTKENNKSNCDDKAIVEEDKDDDNVKEEEKSTSKVISGYYASSSIVALLEEGNIYVSIDPCSPQIESEYCSLVRMLTNSYTKYSFTNFDYETVNLSSFRISGTTVNTGFLGLKLAIENVKTIFPVLNGQAESPSSQGIAIIGEDGTFSFISFLNIAKKELTPIEITELKNTVSIETIDGADAIETHTIDKDGNKHILYNYLKD